jgi:hypothetical protein
MSNTLKQGAAQLKELAGTAAKVAPAPQAAPAPATPLKPQKGARATVLIGGHFPRIVRRSLAQLQADPRNDGKKINDLLAEALNDLFAKYNVPQTAKLDRESRA